MERQTHFCMRKWNDFELIVKRAISSYRQLQK